MIKLNDLLDLLPAFAEVEIILVNDYKQTIKAIYRGLNQHTNKEYRVVSAEIGTRVINQTNTIQNRFVIRVKKAGE